MESAEARRARLKALRDAAAGAEDVGTPSTAPDEPVLKFRNYAVKDQKNIKHDTVEAAQAPEFAAPVVEPSVVQEVQGEGEAIINVAPKKANWDLRRDVAKKLEKLERRTQRALVAIMQEQQKHMLEKEEGQAA
ncbi:hypothetical protein CVIRNUC_010233 [Coccomyxa viridis]|uniref:Coiled-coil domain-containing protein 12 n=1 Tax=Coccomyxa viridis TaxID=1274662 RepID=A0AAV1ILC9_9CHLO|nr:hypothetical protein CVIRNUC_010233 [Coccomyxa viridis]